MDRRTFLTGSAALAAAGSLSLLNSARVSSATGVADRVARKPIPSSGEMLPIVGLGSWITFNVGNDPVLLDECTNVIGAFLDGGGRMIDSSPMYGSAQETIGHALRKLDRAKQVFSTDKIWTSSESAGPGQYAETQAKWGVETFDLMQVHNLLAWEEHLDMLAEKKAAGEVRYVGVTTSHGRRHGELEQIMSSRPIDFVQLTYNIRDREAERRLLPLAKERGIAVIVNRPYQRGALIRAFAGKPLPLWVGEIGATSWPQFLLKFILSHPAVTCAIPATTRVAHVRENLASAIGELPDKAARTRMANYAGTL